MLGKVALKVFRFDPERDSSPHYDRFEVAVREGETVLEALFDILENQDGSLAFRFSCRGAVCGSCAGYINGSYRLACETQLQAAGPEITIDPLPHVPIIRDLVVDMGPFFQKYEKIMPYLKTQSQPPEKEYLQSPQQRKAVDSYIDCILCAACYSACPVVWTNKDYLGPAALAKAYRFVADSRDEADRERIKVVAGEDGIWRCHTIFNCVESCPKKINQTVAIEKLRAKTVSHRLKFWKQG
ncbi:MAG: succinate dehydrogenase iron-sulfur subunit [Chloroflexota bacterium]|nr:succinate dehydrogenase iron-sulfur subunit [Chloroflexota bacterium]